VQIQREGDSGNATAGGEGYITFEYIRNLPQIEFTFIRRSQQFQVHDFVCRNTTALRHLRTAEEIVLKAAAGSLEQVWSTLCQWIPQAADYSVDSTWISSSSK
jgi:hypothetical protein